jgi:hypothetical protein
LGSDGAVSASTAARSGSWTAASPAIDLISVVRTTAYWWRGRNGELRSVRTCIRYLHEYFVCPDA